MLKTSLREKLDALERRIQSACRKAGRNREDVSLVLVSKTHPAERVREAYQLGVRDFGENRVQELLEKKAGLPRDIRWHMIGHLQTNKVKQLLGEAVLIHSLDRLDLAQEVDKRARERSMAPVDCLIQVNSSGEPSKFGLPPGEIPSLVSQLERFSGIRLQGLMTIGPNTQDEDKIRAAFEKIRLLRDELTASFPKYGWKVLSMGMTQDFEMAIEYGSTMIRVGSAVFGERENQDNK